MGLKMLKVSDSLTTNKRNDWNLNKAKELFKSKGLLLDENEYYNDKQKMKCHDCEGYKYMCNLADMRNGRFPYKCHSSNPFTVENIIHYFELIDCGTRPNFSVYVDSKTKMDFICECGNSFSSNLNNVFNGKIYCNFCAKSKRYDEYRDYYKIINNICQSKNYILLTKSILRSNTPFEYICNKHNDKGKQISNYDRMVNRNEGCKYCGIESRGLLHRTDEKIFKELSEEKGFIYKGCDYPRKNNGSIKVRLFLICKKHIDKGIQYISYDNLKTNTSGCIYCNGQGRTKEDLQCELDNLNMNIKILQYIDYSNLQVECLSCSYIWWTYGAQLLQGVSCPCCNQSKGEKAIYNWFKKNHFEFIPQHKFNDCKDELPLPFDFYLPNNNIALEYGGAQHFMPITFGGMTKIQARAYYKKVVKHDSIKTEYCKKNNIPLIRISYEEFEEGDWEYKLFDELVKHKAII